MYRNVVALTGPIACGKGAVSDSLKDLGFTYYSLSDRVREETQARGLTIERETMQNIGDSLRSEFGNHILAERTANLIKDTQEDRIVIDGIRNPAEIEFLRKEFCAKIIGITASPKRRFELLLLRNRPSDPKTREEFDRLEHRDRGIGQSKNGQQVEACLQLADSVIENDGTLDTLRENIQETLRSLGIEGLPSNKESEI